MKGKRHENYDGHCLYGMYGKNQNIDNCPCYSGPCQPFCTCN